MKPRVFDARRLDVKAFARAGGEMAGSWPLPGFERLRDVLAVGDAATPFEEVQWKVEGLEKPDPGGVPEIWLRLTVKAGLSMVCQRCLSPCNQAVSVDRQILFVADEHKAAELDAASEHDVLVVAKELDLHELIEDELLLDLPVVPLHERCPHPLKLEDRADDGPTREHPFAALAGFVPRKD